MSPITIGEWAGRYPPTDYHLVIQRAAKATIARDREQARTILLELPQAPRPRLSYPQGRPPVPAELKNPKHLPKVRRPGPTRRLEVLDKDRWRCGYCGQLVCHPFVLRLLGRLYPDEFIFLGDSTDEDYTNAGALETYATVDHKTPLSQVGGTNEDDNLYAICQDCNQIKGTRTPEQARMPEPVRAPELGWDGAVGLLADLYDRWKEWTPPPHPLSDTEDVWLAHARAARRKPSA